MCSERPDLKTKELQFQITGGLTLEKEFLDTKFKKGPKEFPNGNIVNPWDYKKFTELATVGGCGKRMTPPKRGQFSSNQKI